MPYAVVLELDAEAGAVVRGVWQDLAEAGFSETALSGARPHVSLAIWDTVDPRALAPRLQAFAARISPLTVRFDRTDSFTGSGAVYLAPTPSAGLRSLHADLHARLGDLAASAWPHYQPEAWLPHCTLAMELEPSQIAPALAIAERMRLPLAAHLETLTLVEFPPVRELERVPLTTH